VGEGSNPPASARIVSAMTINQSSVVDHVGEADAASRDGVHKSRRLDNAVRLAAAVAASVVIATLWTVAALGILRATTDGRVGWVPALVIGAAVIVATALCTWMVQPVVSSRVSRLARGAVGEDDASSAST
jgi:hypothetical protein